MNEQEVRKALSGVMDPELGKDIVSLDMVRDIKIDGKKVSFELVLTTPACPLKDTMKKDSEEALKAIGFEEIKVKMGHEVPKAKEFKVSQFIDAAAYEPIKNIIPVYSAKGGVGKSTVAANLAVALSKDGAKVGLMDLDVYGPSIPRMFGITDPPRVLGEKLLPVDAYDVKVMSLGFLFKDSKEPVIWRGPLANSAVKQLFEDVLWEDIDYLVVDMPPGTSDIQITFAQNVPAVGAVFVTTPQQVAWDDTLKGIKMFEKLGIPALGVVNNMGYLICPKCGEHIDLHPKSFMEADLKEMNLPLLADIPMEPQVSIQSDMGVPAVLGNEESTANKAFMELAGSVAAKVSLQRLG